MVVQPVNEINLLISTIEHLNYFFVFMYLAVSKLQLNHNFFAMKVLQIVKNMWTKIRPAYFCFVKILGTITLIGVILSFTDIPYNIYYWLGTYNVDLTKRPDYIILLGGVGMPSPEDLMRTYFAAGAAKEEPQTKIIIAFPPDTANFGGSPEILMARELAMRGIDSNRISFERKGYSTYSQALEIKKCFTPEEADSIGIRIITSPEHMYRAVKTFRKAGFTFVGGCPAFENAIQEKKLFKNKNNKNEKYGLGFRYNMWSYLKYEITVLREFCAIGYYKLRGWI